jgi:hypothetical protein
LDSSLSKLTYRGAEVPTRGGYNCYRPPGFPNDSGGFIGAADHAAKKEVRSAKTVRPAEIGMVLVLLVAGITALFLSSSISTSPCPLPVPPIFLRTVSNEEEIVFLTEYSTYRYSDVSQGAPLSDLRYELARYAASDDHVGPGTVFRSGALSNLNRTGDFQYHDMAAVGEFTPGNDLFILLNPPPAAVQLRISAPDGTVIAWNPVVFCA